MAWYNKYRPEKFDDVLGQDLVKSVMQNAIKKNLIKNAYLLSGPKGVGKTTLARIFAKSLNNVAENGESIIDIIEMDAASNTGIDDVRQLINAANNPPISGKYKVYIIDEVHMLSKQAMNALLKIIEEPPEYLVFLFATTNPEKIIPTVLSRVTKLNLSSHTLTDVVKKLETISKTEGLEIDKKSLEIIAKRAQGSQRDAINLLETISSYGLDKYDSKTTSNLLGLLSDDLLEMSYEYFKTGGDLNSIINAVETSGVDPDAFLAQLFDYCLDQSLNGKSGMGNFIETLAKIISYRLPISSIKSCFALIYSQLYTTPTTTSQIPAENSKSIEETHPKTQPKQAPTPKPKPLEKPQQTPPETIPEPHTKEFTQQEEPKETIIENKEPVVNTQENSSGDVTSDNINSFLFDLKNGSDCPPMLKMILTDLSISSFADGTMTLCVSNGIMENQVKSAKNSAWLKEKISGFLGHKDFEFDVKMEKKPVRKPAAPVQESTPIQEPATNPDIPPAAPIMENQETLEKQEQPLEPKKVTAKIFYKIYKQLPAEIPNSKIPVYANDIPNPEKGDDWSSEIENEFELE